MTHIAGIAGKEPNFDLSSREEFGPILYLYKYGQDLNLVGF